MIGAVGISDRANQFLGAVDGEGRPLLGDGGGAGARAAARRRPARETRQLMTATNMEANDPIRGPNLDDRPRADTDKGPARNLLRAPSAAVRPSPARPSSGFQRDFVTHSRRSLIRRRRRRLVRLAFPVLGIGTVAITQKNLLPTSSLSASFLMKRVRPSPSSVTMASIAESQEEYR